MNEWENNINDIQAAASVHVNVEYNTYTLKGKMSPTFGGITYIHAYEQP